MGATLAVPKADPSPPTTLKVPKEKRSSEPQLNAGGGSKRSSSTEAGDTVALGDMWTFNVTSQGWEQVTMEGNAPFCSSADFIALLALQMADGYCAE